MERIITDVQPSFKESSGTKDTSKGMVRLYCSQVSQTGNDIYTLQIRGKVGMEHDSGYKGKEKNYFATAKLTRDELLELLGGVEEEK